MANQANIKAVITADDQASSTLKKFGNNAGSMSSKLATGLKLAAIGATAAGTAALGFGALSVKAFSESEDAIAQTNAVLKSTGSVAGVTEKAVGDLASSLQNVTKYSDEEIRSAQNMLLTFTKISKDIFPETTETVLNMSAALGQDLKSSSIQVGKALQDPILGVTALRRVGVNFSDAQRDVIKNLVETGRSAEAQKMILKELNTEFGNSARAAGGTLSGQLTILKNKFNDVQEIVGETIAKSFQPFVQKAASFVASVDWSKVVNKSIDSLKDLGSSIANYLAPSVGSLYRTLKSDLIPSLIELGKSPTVRLIGSTLVVAFGAAISVVNGLAIALSAIVNVMNSLGPIIMGVTTSVVAYRVGVAVATLATTGLTAVTTALTAAQVALNAAWLANPIGLLIAGVVGLGVAVYAMTQNTDQASGATSRLNAARAAAKTAADSLKQSEDALRGALLTVEGASLAVEAATIRHNEAVAQFGPTSLQARQANYDLKAAIDAKKRADQEATKAQQDRDTAQQNSDKAKTSVIKAEQAVKEEVQRTTGSVIEQSRNLDFLRTNLDKFNGRSFTYSINQTGNAPSGPGSPGFGVLKRAKGGPVSANTPYFVGENPDGSLNKTSELFIPSSSGTIVNSKDLQGALSGGGSTTFNISIQAGVMTGTDADMRKLSSMVVDSIKDIASSRGTTAGALLA